MENKSEESSNINSAIYILMLTTISYIGAYTYELSYLRGFDVPREFIKINVNLLIISGLAIVSISALILQVMTIIGTINKGFFKETCFAYIFDKYSITFIPLVILALLSDMSLLEVSFFMVITHPIMWIDIITPIFIKNHYGSYNEAFLDITKIENSSDKIFDNFKLSNYSNYIDIALFAFYVLFASSVIGHQASSNKDEFLIDSKSRILIRAYDGTAVMGFLDKEKLTKKFVVVELKGLELEKKKMNITIIKEVDEDDIVIQTMKSIYGYFNNLFSTREETT